MTLKQALQDDARKLLHQDPLALAETLTGKSYKEDDQTTGIGFILNMSLADEKAKQLAILGDTSFRSSWEEWQAIIPKEGFQLLHEQTFQKKDYDNTDTHQIWFNPQLGILLNIESYGHEKVNSANICYNWKPSVENCHDFTSSGGFEHISGTRNFNAPKDEYVWIGQHDVREAFRLIISDLKENGTFVTPWLKAPFLWLLNYADNTDTYKEINAQRISTFSKNVQQTIQGIFP